MGIAQTLLLAEQTKFDLVSIDPSTILLTLINTLIIALFFRFLLWKPVSGVLDKRREQTIKEMEDARIARENAESVKEEYLERLAKSKEEAAEIVAAATKRAEARGEDILAEAARNAELVKQKSEETIERDKKRAVNEIKNQISELVILTAQAVAEKEISAADNARLIDSFLVNIGD